MSKEMHETLIVVAQDNGQDRGGFMEATGQSAQWK